jgi:hypothetical protein
MSAVCDECGAPLDVGGVCRELFHELLALEAAVPGGPGELPHFLAVATYNLQHPSGFAPAALRGLHRTVTDVLERRATLDDARRRARAGAAGRQRVRRHPDEEVPAADAAMLGSWPRRWPMTVRDVCRASPERYEPLVREWASVTVVELSSAATNE